MDRATAQGVSDDSRQWIAVCLLQGSTQQSML
jgi:hypothetical protein